MVNGSAFHGLSGIALSRRDALRMAAQAAGTLSLVASTAAFTSGCSATAGPDWDHHALILALSGIVIPFTATSSAAVSGNADFVLKAVETGLMGVPADVIAKLAADLASRAGNGFLSESAEEQAEVLAVIDKESFAAASPPAMPWYSVKALILMSYYTSEAGMTQELRYELAPGRFDPDVVVDARWRPLSNDWSAVSIRKPIAAK